jgi:hypothetical protein
MNAMEKHFSDKYEVAKNSYQTCPHYADGIDPDLARWKRLFSIN